MAHGRDIGKAADLFITRAGPNIYLGIANGGRVHLSPTEARTLAEMLNGLADDVLLLSADADGGLAQARGENPE